MLNRFGLQDLPIGETAQQAPQRPAPGADRQQQSAGPLTRPSMSQALSQASLASSVPEASMQGSDASEPHEAPQPSTTDPDSTQTAARMHSSKSSQVGPLPALHACAACASVRPCSVITHMQRAAPSILASTWDRQHACTSGRAAPSKRPTPASWQPPPCTVANRLAAQVSTTVAASQQQPGSRQARREASQRSQHHLGGLTWWGYLDDLLRTRLVRGLRNDLGLNNCFLNVVLQCLWHAQPFRAAVLGLSSAALDHCGHGQDAAVLRALHSIFQDFWAPPDHGLPEEPAAPAPAEPPGAVLLCCWCHGHG